MKIKKLEIKKFRHIENQTIDFGDNLTVITGQNSTGKSSILGWIAQACVFKNGSKTLTGGSFKSKYSEIFRFCKENDYSNKYEVSLFYETSGSKKVEEKIKIMKTRFVPKTKKGAERYRVDFDKRGVAINFPVIFLGLRRLIPLASEKNISLKNITLESEEKRIFSNLSKEILILLDRDVSSERIKSTNKDILAMKTKNYGHLGNSAGQDNIGQIISALLSFRRLKNNQGSQYDGGILLIDELDATLYAGSQIQLIKKLYKYSIKYNIQIVFTTHSLEILEHFSDKTGLDVKINFLELKNGKIKNKLNPPIDFLKNKIKVQIGNKNKIKKIEFVCEDDVTEMWCKNLVNGTEFKDNLNIKKGPFGDGDLVKMAESKHPIFKELFFVLDGDCKNKYAKKKVPPKTIFLPGDRPPEVIFYNFLKNLSDEDDFWIEDDQINFSKQTCFQQYQNSKLTVAKRWFKDEDLSQFFGRGYSRLFNRWKKDNKDLVEEFHENIKNSLNV